VRDFGTIGTTQAVFAAGSAWFTRSRRFPGNLVGCAFV